MDTIKRAPLKYFKTLIFLGLTILAIASAFSIKTSGGSTGGNGGGVPTCPPSCPTNPY